MGSLLGVADTKGAIYDALPVDGVAVINADDAFAPTSPHAPRTAAALRFGLRRRADVSANHRSGTRTPLGRFRW